MTVAYDKGRGGKFYSPTSSELLSPLPPPPPPKDGWKEGRKNTKESSLYYDQHIQ